VPWSVWVGPVEVTIKNADRILNALAPWERGELLTETLKLYAADLRKALEEYPPYKYVSRKQAYGVPFFSDRQRRWFFAALRSGELQLPYSRTMKLQNSWEVRPLSGSQVWVTNSAPYAGFVIDKERQSRMARLIGWRTCQDIVGGSGFKLVAAFHEACRRLVARTFRTPGL
jgi:hypothetical protein